jgi:hypothetical protein
MVYIMWSDRNIRTTDRESLNVVVMAFTNLVGEHTDIIPVERMNMN